MVSPENMTTTETPIIAVYEIRRKNFFLVEIEVLAVKNSVIMKYGATNALVKKDMIYIALHVMVKQATEMA